MKKNVDDWRATSVFVRSETAVASSVHAQPKKQSLLVAMLGIPFTAVRRLIAESQPPATRAGGGGKFMIARTAIVKYSERIK
jgi:hypothetical protein